MNDEPLPKGYRCPNPTCGRWEDFHVWVFAHWDEILTHHCDDCKWMHWLLRGRVIRSKKFYERKNKKSRV